MHTSRQLLTVYLTKPEAMIHNEQARNNYPDPESVTEHLQFQRHQEMDREFVEKNS